MAEPKPDSSPPTKEPKKEIKKDDDLVINDSTVDKPELPRDDQEETDAGSGAPNDKESGEAAAEPEQEPPAKLTETVSDPSKPTSKRRFRRKRIILATAVAVLLIAVLILVPVTRYAILGVAIKRDVTITLTDTKTNKPVSSVTLWLDGKSATTDAKGVATLKSVPVGSKKLTANKKYYKDLSASVMVPITGNSPSAQLDIEATGRQVPVKVLNKISKQPLEGAQVAAADTSSKTDKNGEAVLVLPADKAETDVAVTAEGYNNLAHKVTVTEQMDDKNTFALTPAGKLYFLSNRSGTIDVMKSDLDGGNVQTVVKGTGKEDNPNTVLVASQDWKYLALKSRRDSDKPKLYFIETATGKLNVIDEGDVDFGLVGWHNSHFVYSIYRTKLQGWEPKRQALKSFNAASGSLSVLDETGGEGGPNGFATEQLKNIYILKNEIVYQKDWASSQPSTAINGKSQTLNSVQPDGGSKRVVKSYAAQDGISFGPARVHKPQELYFETFQSTGKRTFWKYKDGSVAEVKDLDPATYYAKYYQTYLLSPSGKNTFWYEQRDGKNVLLVGNATGNDSKEVATLSEFTPYGWYSDDYFL